MSRRLVAMFAAAFVACSPNDQDCPGTIVPPAYYGPDCLVIVPIGRDSGMEPGAQPDGGVDVATTSADAAVEETVTNGDDVAIDSSMDDESDSGG